VALQSEQPVRAADELRLAFERREMEVERRINLLRAALVAPFAITDSIFAVVGGRIAEVAAIFVPSLVIGGFLLLKAHRVLSDGTYHPSVKYVTITVDALFIAVAAIGLHKSQLYASTVPDQALAGVFIATALLFNGIGALRLGRAAIVYSGFALVVSSLVSTTVISGSLHMASAALVLLTLSTVLNLAHSSAVGRMFERLRKREAMMRFLPRSLVDSVDRGEIAVELGGERRQVAFLMSDIRGFTAISEGLPAERVVAFLNGYLETMVEIVMNHHGTIVDIIGDAVFAVFGAPVDDPENIYEAVRCAVVMQLGMGGVNQKSGADFPDVEIGIGVHQGEVVVGNIGSSAWMKYGAVGSHVNLTARIESYTVGGQVMVSDAVADALGERLVLGDHLSVSPKGVESPVTLHDLLGLGDVPGAVLEEAGSVCEALAHEPTVELVLLEGKKADSEPVAARLVALAERGAAVRSALDLPLLTNLKIRFSVDDETVEVYAKVRRTQPELDAVFCRFTFVPDGAAGLLQRIRDTEP
jgi:adenylate cyclase